jgi:hypothetical protein
VEQGIGAAEGSQSASLTLGTRGGVRGARGKSFRPATRRLERAHPSDAMLGGGRSVREPTDAAPWHIPSDEMAKAGSIQCAFHHVTTGSRKLCSIRENVVSTYAGSHDSMPRA